MSQQINLFNPIFLKQQKYFSALTMLQALGLLLLGALALVAYTNFQVKRLTSDLDQVRAYKKMTEANLREAQLRYSAEDKVKALNNQIAQAERDLVATQKVAHTLETGDFGNTKGFSDSFLALARQSVSGLWLTQVSVTDGGNEMDIRGRALVAEKVPDYINRLKSEPSLKGKSFDALNMRVPHIERVVADKNGATETVDAPYIEFALIANQTVEQSKTKDGAAK